ncbi:MAG: NAD(P)/FAD-dependent oxidoreductase [Candidatus Heimdallarchaeaceae archaeon]
MDSELLIVGGGPAGLLSAISSAKKRIEVKLFESKNAIGEHEHCAGLLSIEGLKKIGLSRLPDEVIQNRKVRGALIYSESGEELCVAKQSSHAYVVNRSNFDRHLATLAEDKGVRIVLDSRIKYVRRTENSILLQLGKKQNHEQISGKVVILAEGRYPHLNSQIKLPTPSRNKIVFASQHIVEGVNDLNEEYVELYLTQKYAPGFFAWVIPMDENRAKIGLAAQTQQVSHLLRAFYKKHPLITHRLKSAHIIKKMSGAIPLGSFIKRTYTYRALVVGDAAGQTKPTTGGGVIFGGIAAQIAGDIAAEAILKDNFSLRLFAQYEKKWKKEFKRELQKMYFIRQYLNSLDDEEINKLIRLLRDPKIQKKFQLKGDVDAQSRIVISLLSSPKLWPFIVRTGIKYMGGKIFNILFSRQKF